jgi:arsenate reductase
MAEAFTRELRGDVIEPYSAGTRPWGILPETVEVMQEVSIDLTGQYSKHVDELKDVEFDYVVTVCDHARESCPVFPRRTKMVHVGFDDPPRLASDAKTHEEAMGHYRRVRDEIKAFVETLPEALEKK